MRHGTFSCQDKKKLLLRGFVRNTLFPVIFTKFNLLGKKGHFPITISVTASNSSFFGRERRLVGLKFAPLLKIFIPEWKEEKHLHMNLLYSEEEGGKMFDKFFNHLRPTPEDMLSFFLYGLCSLTVLFLLPVTTWADEGMNHRKDGKFLSGEQVIVGTVEEIRGNQAQVNTGEVQPRYVPMNIRKEKGLPALQQGDQVEITVNDQNLIVDLHLSGEKTNHKILRGRLAQPLVTGHEKAVIRSQDHEKEYMIRPLARSKVASLPVGTEAVFLIDEMNQIMDVTYDSQEEVDKAQYRGEKRTPLKGNFKKVTGVLVQSLQDNTISIQKEGSKEHRYEVRPLIQKKMKNLSPGQIVVLFIDDENKVTDAAFSEDDAAFSEDEDEKEQKDQP